MAIPCVGRKNPKEFINVEELGKYHHLFNQNFLFDKDNMKIVGVGETDPTNFYYLINDIREAITDNKISMSGPLYISFSLIIGSLGIIYSLNFRKNKPNKFLFD